jgi:hypothetical protein
MSSFHPISPASSFLSVSLFKAILPYDTPPEELFAPRSRHLIFLPKLQHHFDQTTHTFDMQWVQANLADEHPHPTVASPYASHPTNALPDLAVPGTVSPSTYLQLHTTSTATPLTDSMNPPHLRALPSQQWCISLSRSHSATDIRSVAAQASSHYLFSNATEARYQQQRRNSYHGVTTDFPSLNSELVSAAPSHSSADSVTSSSWVYRRAEELQGVRYAIPTSGAYAWDCC